MKLKRFYWIILYIIIIAIPSLLYIVNAININSDFLFLLAGVLGITSYVIFSFQFLLTSRPKFIDKYFGLDRIYRFHMIIALVALVLGYIHSLLKGIYFEDSPQTTIGDAALIIFAFISVLSILLMINRLFFKIKIVDSLRKLLNNILKLKYETKVLFHNLMLLGLIVLLVHILMANLVNFNLPLKIVIFIYIIIPLGLYFNHKIIKVYFNKDKRYIVSEIIHDADNIITLKFTAENGKIFNYSPGQFLYLKIYNPEIPSDEHPFTISSSPAQKDYISTTIKQIGDFSNSLNKVKVGDKAYIDGPFGSFSYLKKPDHKKICFIAGGIGITPFLSMLRYMASKDKDNHIVLLWGISYISEIICKDELEGYKTLLKSFKLVPVLSNDNRYEGEKGFIDIEKIKKYIDSIIEYDFYICGPPVMMDMELNNLKKLGVPQKNIHFERFSS